MKGDAYKEREVKASGTNGRPSVRRVALGRAWRRRATIVFKKAKKWYYWEVDESTSKGDLGSNFSVRNRKTGQNDSEKHVHQKCIYEIHVYNNKNATKERRHALPMIKKCRKTQPNLVRAFCVPYIYIDPWFLCMCSIIDIYIDPGALTTTPFYLSVTAPRFSNHISADSFFVIQFFTH
eukprot:GEMP01078994.1.p1 GENE.GEMP01078994.1~~GEMP01078994.1.p1  ORF type:complete len:179 (-),score=5.68 GEMP01078994.1:210-746(-)